MTYNKRGRGRPKKDPEKTLNNRVILRLTDAEKEALEKEAAGKSLSLSEYIRLTLKARR